MRCPLKHKALGWASLGRGGGAAAGVRGGKRHKTSIEPIEPVDLIFVHTDTCGICRESFSQEKARRVLATMRRRVCLLFCVT